MKTFVLDTLAETIALGRLLGRAALPGDVICLDGDLGAGKTTLTQAIAQGLEVPEQEYVTSPSFAVFHEYPGRIPLYHMDFYRLNDPSEVLDMGLDEYFSLSGLTVLEWCERAGALIPAMRLKIHLSIQTDATRRLSFDPGTGSWRTRLPELLAQCGWQEK